MKNILYMAEKANAGADIARVLGLVQKNSDGFYAGDFADKRIVVAWASGHYVTLKEPADIDEKYSKWNVDDLPITFDLRTGLKVVPGKEKAFNTLASYLQAADVIVNCGDAGREGELIQRWIYKLAGAGSKPVKRMWTSSLTDKGITEANNNLKDSSEFDSLYASGETRAVMDAFLGFNYSRALSLLKSDGVTIAYGRCQTPLLRAIVDRDMEIENFVSVPFSYIAADVKTEGGSLKAVLSDQKSRERIEFSDIADAQSLLNTLSGNLIVSNTLSERKKTSPKKPYNTLQLQKDMDAKYGFSAAKTDKILQGLYDTHKMITYPRTDSSFLACDMAASIKNNLSALNFGYLGEYVRSAALSEIPKRYYKEDTGEHHAIIPEDVNDLKERYAKLSEDEKRVFDAVARRFISLFYSEEIYEKITIELLDSDNLFIAKGRNVIDPGWKKVYDSKDEQPDDEDENENICFGNIGKGEVLTGLYEVKENQTKPKKKYTESSLLTLMDINGIGTAATRSNLISELTKPKGKNKEVYVEKKKNHYRSTELGRAIIKVIPEYMSNLDFLSAMDQKIQGVAAGEISQDEVISGLIKELDENLKLLRLSSGEKTLVSKRPDKKESDLSCPLCGKVLYEYNDKGYGCSGFSENSCSFFVHKVKAKKKLSGAQLKKLLSEGKTDTIKGFTSKAGKKFDAELKLTRDGKVIFAFQDK